MRVGLDYQAEIPELIKTPFVDVNLSNDWSSPVWIPNLPPQDAKIDVYLDYAMSKHDYSQEQALGLLFWHQHNTEKAISDLGLFAPLPDEWSTEDKVLFEQAFSFLGKNFTRIHNMLPEKSVGSLVKYYYSWKKRKNNTSSMDGCVVNNSKEKNVVVDPSRKVKMDCWMSCKWSHVRNKSLFDLHLDADELSLLATGNGDQMFRIVQDDLTACRRKVAANKHVITNMKRRLPPDINKFRNPEMCQTMTSKWTNTELLLAIQGFRHYGLNYQAISEVLGTKSEYLVRNFFINYKVRYNLDEVINEFEKEKKIKQLVMADDSSLLNSTPVPPPQQQPSQPWNSTTSTTNNQMSKSLKC